MPKPILFPSHAIVYAVTQRRSLCSSLRDHLRLFGAGLGGSSALEHALGVADTGGVALLDTLEGKGGDESGADTGTVLSGHDLDRVVALAERLAVTATFPVEDLLESLSTTGLEVGVLNISLV